MHKVVYLFAFLMLVGCGGKKGMKISTTEIDQYVEMKSSDDQIYDVSQSLRFATKNSSNTYEVVRYMQNDTVILYRETEITDEKYVVRQTFYKSGVAIFIDEFTALNQLEMPFKHRKIYLDGVSVLTVKERSANTEEDLEVTDFTDGKAKFEDFKFEKPELAMTQKGPFEMRFEDFLIMPPQTFLILGNEESLYEVALFVSEPHDLLDQINLDRKAYVGRPFFVTHQFILMAEIERMHFLDGFFTDEKTDNPN
jgi:hypothetical protein